MGPDLVYRTMDGDGRQCDQSHDRIVRNAITDQAFTVELVQCRRVEHLSDGVQKVSEIDGDISDDDVQGSGYGMTGQAKIGSLYLSFIIRGYLDVEKATGVKPPEFPESRDNETTKRHNALRAVAQAEALEGSLAKDLPGIKLQAIADFSEGTDTAGPGGLPAAIAAIVLRDTPLGHLAELLGVADATIDFLRWIDDKGGLVVHVDDGAAFLIGWRAIREAKDAVDLEAAFVEPIKPKLYDWEGQLEGYLVGLRDDANIYEVPVALDGTPGEVITVPLGLFTERQRAMDDKAMSRQDDVEAAG